MIGDTKENIEFLKEKSRNTWWRRVECTGKISFWNFWKPEMFWWESCPTLLIKFGDFEFYEINIIMLPRHSARQNINGNHKENLWCWLLTFVFITSFVKKWSPADTGTLFKWGVVWYCMESSRHRYTVPVSGGLHFFDKRRDKDKNQHHKFLCCCHLCSVWLNILAT